MQDLLTPGNIVVAVIVVVALIVGGRKVVGGLAGTQSCCGEHEGARAAAAMWRWPTPTKPTIRTRRSCWWAA